jgi:hypothetical protein
MEGREMDAGDVLAYSGEISGDNADLETQALSNSSAKSASSNSSAKSAPKKPKNVTKKYN